MIISAKQFTFASKDADKAESMFRELRDASVKEPGVVQFEVGRSPEKPTLFDAHRATEQFQRLVVNGIRPLAQQRNVETLIPI